MMKHWGLRRKFIVVFLLLITLPTIYFGFIIYDQTTDVLKEQAEEDIVEKLERNEQNLSSIITGIENMSSYMTYDKDFRTFFTTAKANSTEMEYKDALEGIEGYFTFQIMSNEYISSIDLESDDGQIFHFGEPVIGEEKELDRLAYESKGAPVWSNSYTLVSNWSGENKSMISLSRVINNLTQINEPIGMVRIRLDQEKLLEAIETKIPSHQGNYFLMSKSGEIVLHHDQSLVGKQHPDQELVDWVVNGKGTSYRYETDVDSFLAVKSLLGGTDWLSVALVAEEEVVGGLYKVRTSILYMIVFLLLFGVVAIIGFYRSNIMRIMELTDQTKQLEKGNYTASVVVHSKDEIGKLGMRFNKMVQTIDKHIETEYKLEIKQKESELKALQNQIDPHFLYNTLDMIRWTARLENAMETGLLIERLSKVFRMNLNKGKMWLELQEEVLYIQNYLELQKKRLGDRLDFHIFIDNQMKDVYVMKQILQPLVENSIQHGFKNLSRKGIITIRCYKVTDQLWIDVIDNGHGFSIKAMEDSQEQGYALKNLTERIEIAFGKAYGLNVLDTEEGTIIRLVLPILRDEGKVDFISKETGE